ERRSPARAVGRRARRELVAVEALAEATADRLRAGGTGGGHDRAGAVGLNRRDRRVDLRDLARVDAADDAGRELGLRDRTVGDLRRGHGIALDLRRANRGL